MDLVLVVCCVDNNGASFHWLHSSSVIPEREGSLSCVDFLKTVNLHPNKCSLWVVLSGSFRWTAHMPYEYIAIHISFIWNRTACWSICCQLKWYISLRDQVSQYSIDYYRIRSMWKMNQMIFIVPKGTFTGQWDDAMLKETSSSPRHGTYEEKTVAGSKACSVLDSLLT